MIIVSLLLPTAWFINTAIPNQITQTSNNALIDYGIFDASCTAEALEAECSRLLLDDETFCDCDQIYLNNVVAYKSNIWLNKFIAFQPFLLFMLGLVVLFLFTRHLIKIREIIKLKGSSFIEPLNFNEIKFNLVRTPKPLAFSSFQLKDKYVIWPIHESLPLSETERAAILHHELSHLKQKNTWEHLMLSVFQLVWFAHPIFYQLKRELVLLSEFIADEFALKQSTISKKEYAHLLVNIKEQQLLAGTQGFQKHFLEHRVQRILNSSTSYKRNKFIIPVLIWLCISIFITFQAKNQFETNWTELTAYEKATFEHIETGRNLFCGSCLFE